MFEEKQKPVIVEVNSKEDAKKTLGEFQKIQYSRLKGRILGIVEQSLREMNIENEDKINDIKKTITYCLKNVSNDGAKILEKIIEFI
jgi:hypothetical protein